MVHELEYHPKNRRENYEKSRFKVSSITDQHGDYPGLILTYRVAAIVLYIFLSDRVDYY